MSKNVEPKSKTEQLRNGSNTARLKRLLEL